MKKKFLSLMMAAAVVATTSVSAFAAETTQNITVAPSEDSEVTIPMKGDITDNKGATVPSSISVTVPTAANFTVNKDGVLQASNITITSHGEKVEVVTGKFKDSTGIKEIEVVAPSTFKTGVESVPRNKVSLKIQGTDGTVYLKTESQSSNSSGIYDYEKDGESGVTSLNDKVLGYAVNGAPLKLDITGEAGRLIESGEEGNQKAISDKFTLTLKIRKAKQSQPSQESAERPLSQ